MIRIASQAMGEAGREFALTRFDAKVMVEALEKVYCRSFGPSPAALGAG